MSDINEKLTTEHDIYISVDLKNPMKPSAFKEIIDSLLFENIGYMTSWGTHTKDEWIQIATEQEVKIKSLITTIESLQGDMEAAEIGLKSYREEVKSQKEEIETLRTQYEKLKVLFLNM